MRTNRSARGGRATAGRGSAAGEGRLLPAGGGEDGRCAPPARNGGAPGPPRCVERGPRASPYPQGPHPSVSPPTASREGGGAHPEAGRAAPSGLGREGERALRRGALTRGRRAVAAQDGGAGGSARGGAGGGDTPERPGGLLGAGGLQKGRSALRVGLGLPGGGCESSAGGWRGGFGVSRVRGVPLPPWLRPWGIWRVWGLLGNP